MAFTTVVLSPVLTFVADALHSSTDEEGKIVCRQFYSLEELNSAKELLWAADKDNILGRMIQRRGSTAAKGDNLDKKCKVIADIVDAIPKLDEADALPLFTATASDLPRIPKVKPHEVLPISAYERIAALEEQMEAVMAASRRPPSVPTHVEAELATLSSLPARVADLEKKIAGPIPMSYARSLHPVPQGSHGGAPPASDAQSTLDYPPT